MKKNELRMEKRTSKSRAQNLYEADLQKFTYLHTYGNIGNNTIC